MAKWAIRRQQSEPSAGSQQPGSLRHVVRRYQQESKWWTGAGPTPGGADACVNQRNGTLVLARMGAEMACWRAVSLARFLGLACALLVAAKSVSFVSLLVALLACCLSVYPTTRLPLDLLQSLILFEPPLAATPPPRMLHLCLAVFIKFSCCVPSLWFY